MIGQVEHATAVVRSILVGAVLVALILSGPGCGPSLRRTEQSDNAFLRCFDGDYHPGRALAEKESCWSAWLERRVYNQPADKVAYAELRLTELVDGISVPGPPGPAATPSRPAASAVAPEAVPNAGQPARLATPPACAPASTDSRSGTGK
ncbi:MAG TPA: hypothetical protein VM285_17260 [Polyangia bacterium]|nr:hypothetical protein [Polyangia bacterium]